ncbi:hypothetical protein D2E16_07625 [Streptococcus suis]|nr:hypothetical protein D2E16_07625 [Streptococcus suis]
MARTLRSGAGLFAQPHSSNQVNNVCFRFSKSISYACDLLPSTKSKLKYYRFKDLGFRAGRGN